MSRIDDLIKQFAPRGVEYKTLGDVAEVVRGKRFVKADMVDSGVPCIHYGEIYTKYGLSTSTSYSFLEPARAKSLRVALPGDLVVATAGETIEDIGNAVAWLGSEPVVIHDACYAVRSALLDATFLSYLFRTAKFKGQIRKWVSSSKISSISTQNLSQALVPVPPLEVQREIVRILETFTELEAELEAELAAELVARRQQYAHYRDALLVADSEADWMNLSEIATFKYGYTDKARVEGDYRFIRITDISPNGKLLATDAKFVAASAGADGYLVGRGDLLVARTGATYGKTVLIGAIEPAVYASFLIRIQFNAGTLLPAYYWHFAQSDSYWDQANRLVSGGAQPQFNANVLKTVRVPVPSIEEQRRAVELLNSFDALMNDLSSGLSAEIGARRQRYAYYRDRLLSFEEASA